MTCTNCSLAVATDARFCDNCGAALVSYARRPAQATQQPFAQPSQPVVAVVRNPGVAMLLSIFFPGAGQLYNGQIGKGIGIFASCVVCACLAFLIVPAFISIGIWIWGIIDAYQNAKTTLTA